MRTRTVGFAFLGVSGASIVVAVALGVAAAQNGWEKGTVVSSTVALAVVAEACFWIGGGMLGLSVIRRRKEAIARFFGRRPQN